MKNNNNMTLKEALNFVESIEYLHETNEEEFRSIRSEMVDLLELQILKNEFIENISKCNNFKFLYSLNNTLKIAIEKNYK
ncbi:hypothetical protein [Paraclostridium bifermentans]|uniref:hypothetical protein n=1 Tax=Paraclostridium bifermentans TaxID=1490 RepID=UPI002432953B|nr:hypothetical protein [Paraclostridium bifermentans]